MHETPTVFDSHCHLTDFEAPLDGLAQAQAAGVRSVLTCGYNEESNAAVCALRRQAPGLPVALGLHPWFVDQEIEPVLKLIHSERPDVIGEAGLDLWGETPVHPRERQIYALEAQLHLAAELGLPITLHSRKAIDLLYAVMRNHRGVRGALHAYSGSPEQLRPLLELGLYVGFGGAVTRSRARRIHRVAAYVPLDRILLETDAPAIGMDIVEPPHVRPSHLPRVLQALAEIRKMPAPDLEAATDQNARALFGECTSVAPHPADRA